MATQKFRPLLLSLFLSLLLIPTLCWGKDQRITFPKGGIAAKIRES
jgi:hypothetical protein